MSILSKFFGDPNKKVLDKIQPIVEKVNNLEPEFEKLSDAELKNKTEEFKKRLNPTPEQVRQGAKQNETLDDILPEAFATVREASKRTLGQRHFDVQILGGVVLHHGKISEMKTGEGKTLVATLPLYLNALTGKGAHLITVNDYLSKRDVNWMGPIYNFLGFSVGCILHDKAFIFNPNPETKPDNDEVTIEEENLREVLRKDAYAYDILYGTNNEFGFDYLRDNMAYSLEQMVQRQLNFAIVDEVDSILIDEARTPLIISAPDMESAQLYKTFTGIVPKLKENDDFNVDEKMKAVTLTEEGVDKVEKMLGVGNIYQEKGIAYVHHLEQALKAEILFKRDKDYVVKNGEVIIVDDFTGRLMQGRRYSEGLHQAIEAKENLEVQKESRTLATITFQNYFRLYRKLAGMTGTAETSAEEFSKVYNLEVIVIPSNKLMIRKDFSDKIFKTENGKFQALAREVKERNQKGQPILIGTIAIEKSEYLSAVFRKEGIQHEILNAKHHEKEAKIISRAGQKNAVTIATNMAGRGTDIKLGEGVAELGGLHIVGTERHEARRIDNQLRGRTGRQGDPGSSQFFVSMEDELMRIFGSDKMKNMMDKLGVPDDQPIENKLISKSIESAQSKIEGHHFDMRKHILEYDDVMNKQREVIYKKRKEILEISSTKTDDPDYLKKLEKLKEKILEMIKDEIQEVVLIHTQGIRADWNTEEICEAYGSISHLPNDAHSKLIEVRNKNDQEEKAREEMENYLFSFAESAYEAKEKELTSEAMRQIEKAVSLRTIDTLWMEHLDAMEEFRRGVGLRGYGQKDPLIEYKKEGYGMFQKLLGSIQSGIVNTIYKVGIVQRQAPQVFQDAKENSGSVTYKGGDETSASVSPIIKNKPGRNDPCPCGSGKKYKKCCGA